MATEPIQGGPYPVPADPPDGPVQIKGVTDWAATRLNMRFASTAARDAAIPTPVSGMECVIGNGSAQVKYLYTGSVWSVLTSGGSLDAGRRWAGAPFAMAGGVVEVNCTGGVGELMVTLPSGRFTGPPRVLLSSIVTAASTANFLVAAANISTTNFTARVRNVPTPTYTGVAYVQWLAYQE